MAVPKLMQLANGLLYE